MARNTDNMDIKMAILNTLFKVEYTSTYAFIIRDNRLVKVAIVENANTILPFITVVERSAKSKGTEWKVRMWNSTQAFETIKTYAKDIVTLCTVEQFETEFTEWKEQGNTGNRGDFGEWKTAKALNGTQNTSKTAKCSECGDIRVNGTEIQVKLWNATITTETTMINLNGKLE